MVDIPTAFPLKPYTGYGREFLLLSSQPSPLLPVQTRVKISIIALSASNTAPDIKSVSSAWSCMWHKGFQCCTPVWEREREDDGPSESTLVVATHCQLCQRVEVEEKLTGLALLWKYHRVFIHFVPLTPSDGRSGGAMFWFSACTHACCRITGKENLVVKIDH